MCHVTMLLPRLWVTRGRPRGGPITSAYREKTGRAKVAARMAVNSQSETWKRRRIFSLTPVPRTSRFSYPSAMSERAQRRPAAVMAADAVGYPRADSRSILRCRYQQNHPWYFSCRVLFIQSLPVIVPRQCADPQLHFIS